MTINFHVLRPDLLESVLDPWCVQVPANGHGRAALHMRSERKYFATWMRTKYV